MPIYVRDLHPPSSPTLSELSSTVSTTTKAILRNLDHHSIASDTSDAQTWLKGWLERKVVEPTWDEHMRNEQKAKEKLIAPKATDILQPTPIDTADLEIIDNLDDLHFCRQHRLYVYLSCGQLYVNQTKLECKDTIETIFEVIETELEIEQPGEPAEGDDSTQDGDTIPTINVKLPLLVIIYQSNLGEVRVVLNFNGQFANYSDDDSDEALELSPEEMDPLTLNPRSIIPEEGSNGQAQPTNNFRIYETVYNEESSMLAMNCRKEQNDENCIKVLKLPLTEWQTTIKEGLTTAAENNEPLRIENRNFLPTDLQWERREITDAKYDNLSDGMAKRYRKLHIYLNKAHDRPVSSPECEQVKNLYMFWADKSDLVVCWTHSSANKIQIFRIKDKPAAKGAKGPSESSQTVVAKLMLVDDVRQMDFRGGVLVCVCGIEQRNVFVYHEWNLWCTIKGDGPIADVQLTAQADNLLVSYRDNSILSYSITCSGHQLTNLQKALQIISEPEPVTVKSMYPQDLKIAKNLKIHQQQGSKVIVHDSGNLPIAISADGTSSTLNSDVPHGVPVRKVTRAELEEAFFLLFENGQVMHYQMPETTAANECCTEA